MGCDIHAYAELRKDGAWRSIRELVKNAYYNPEDPGEGPELEMPRVLGERNYQKFAVLAGVRNGSGFAGADLGDPTRPISEPRGVPEDASPEYRAEVDRWGGDGHSHSWLTLADFYGHDWTRELVQRCWIRRDKTVQIRGSAADDFVDPDAFAEQMRRLATTFPDDYWRVWGNWGAESCGWSSEGLGASGWRVIEWATKHRHVMGHQFWRELFDLTVAARQQGVTGAEDVRLVFFFDN